MIFFHARGERGGRRGRGPILLSQRPENGDGSGWLFRGSGSGSDLYIHINIPFQRVLRVGDCFFSRFRLGLDF